MIRAIKQRKKYFANKHGFVPDFRAGAHCGEVVAGEIGENRRQIVFVGDVVNTAARVEGKAHEMGRSLLISGVMLRLLELPGSLAAESIGFISLKGKSRSIELFEIR